MNRRDFLKLSGAIVAATILPSAIVAQIKPNVESVWLHHGERLTGRIFKQKVMIHVAGQNVIQDCEFCDAFQFVSIPNSCSDIVVRNCMIRYSGDSDVDLGLKLEPGGVKNVFITDCSFWCNQ